MGLLEELEFLSSRRNDNGVPVKRGPLSRSTDNESLNKLEAQRPQNQEASMLRNRSRLSRFIRFEKVDYLQWICAILVFLFMVILFQAFLPGWVTEKSNNPETPFFEAVEETGYGSLELRFLKELGGLDFGEGIRFEPSKLLEKFQRESREENLTVALTRPGIRLPLRKPHLALVLSDLAMDSSHLLMISVAVSLRAIGYAIQEPSKWDAKEKLNVRGRGIARWDAKWNMVQYHGKPYSLEDGPSRVIWRNIGLSVNILQSRKPEIAVDWLIFDGVLVSSLGTRDVISCLLQEPFKSLPLIWTIHDSTLALRLRHYTSNGHFSVIDDWKQAFIRATVVVFPDYVLPMRYSAFDAGNFFVIPSSSAESWEAHKFMALNKERDLRAEMGYSQDDFVIAIAGSQFSYSGMWLEHALVMQALVPVFADFHSDNSSALRLKVGILSGNSTSTYKVVLQAITLSIGYPRGSVQLVGMDGDVSSFLSIADLVIYGSFHEEQSFPSLLIRAMCFGKPIVAPDLAIIRKYVDNRVNGYLFPKENISVLTQVLFEAISKGKLSLLARSIASIGKGLARNLMVSDAVEGYAALLGNVIKFPSEVTLPKSVAQIPQRIKKEWQWHLIDKIADLKYWNLSTGGSRFVDKVEELWNHTVTAKSSNTTNVIDEVFSLIDWEEEKAIEIVNARKRLEEELKDRNDQPRGTWEDVYQSARRADRSKNELHERDDRELERTGQPLCIYEPYFGEGTWPFLHNSSLYRGIGLSTKGRRPRADDVDAPSRLPVLTNSYYRDALGEYGAFFALATRIDSVHKNSWIGFHSWRASARKVSLSKLAENALLDAIKKHRHGDALYFWVRMDKDPRNHQLLDFWSFCDAINAGNCRFAVSEALRRMYGVRRDWDSLPPMPADGDSWSVMHSWALPTRSFLELVMFSRMFVDALDAQIYDEHNGTGRCYLSLSKDQHCFTRVLELMVNVWAYHSARRMVYVNPETGSMQVQHRMRNRRGRMWVRWFSFAMLKSMDEDLAEESYSDHPSHRWLWPSTGEVYWQGVYERERTMSQRQKADRKRQSKGNVNRIRRRTHQKALGKYLKVPPEEMVNTNSTATMGSVRKFRRVGGKTPVTV